LQTAKATSEDPLLNIVVNIAVPVDMSDMPAETLESNAEAGLLFRNGEETNRDALKRINLDRGQRLLERAFRVEAARAAQLEELSRRENLTWSKKDTAELAQDPLISVQLRASDVARFLKANRDLIAGMDIQPDSTPSTFATAMKATLG
jgi:hypothetical protein